MVHNSRTAGIIEADKFLAMCGHVVLCISLICFSASITDDGKLKITGNVKTFVIQLQLVVVTVVLVVVARWCSGKVLD